MNNKCMNERDSRMKSKKILIAAIVIATGICITVLLLPKLLGKNLFGLNETGSFYENISDFALDPSSELDELTKSYLENIRYEIIDVDKENMTATVNVSIPVINNELSDILDKVITENSGKDYEELKQIAEIELTDLINSGQIEKEKSTLTLQIIEDNGSYKLVPSDRWNERLTANFENLYMNYLKSLIGGISNETSE